MLVAGHTEISLHLLDIKCSRKIMSLTDFADSLTVFLVPSLSIYSILVTFFENYWMDCHEISFSNPNLSPDNYYQIPTYLNTFPSTTVFGVI